MKNSVSVIAAALLGAVTVFLGGCGRNDVPLTQATMTPTIAATDTRLGRGIGPTLIAHPGKTGIHPLPLPRDAFAARGLLAKGAERSLDIQYYIWQGDITGYLLFEAVWQAAERGVHVRLLLDDNNTTGLDATLAALDAHASIEVRLYNPLFHRRMRWINYVTDFKRINRRMHNKSFTVDNQVTVVGGRNIGDDYFSAGHGIAFDDLDVLAVGPIVGDVAKAFDLYWNSASAFPVAQVLGDVAPEALAQLKEKFAAMHAEPESAEYLESLRQMPIVTALCNGDLSMQWADARLVYDNPAKTLDSKTDKDALVLTQLLVTAGSPVAGFDLVSPYFVPMAHGTEALTALAARGVKVRVLTNALESTDVGAVHAGYSKRRKELLRAGIQLYELKRANASKSEYAKQSAGNSSAGLHAKTFQIDGARMFVGSFNFDPRSAVLNTEMGVLIDSPALAQDLKTVFDSKLSLLAYEVGLNDDDSLQWIERTPLGEKVYDTEPGVGVMRRAGVGFLSLLPIDWML